MRYLGIDYGTKKVGLALSDEMGMMGFPHAIVPNDTRLLGELIALVKREQVGGVVMGESRDYQGAENPIAEGARSLAAELEKATGVPVHFEPEVLTTQEARRLPDGTRMAGMVDASAAALILTSYLSRN